jgi:hypothetical protein
MVIIQNLVGGLGNQLFMIFNLVSLSIDNNINFFINQKRYDFKRKDFTQYKIFNTEYLKTIYIDDFNNYKLIKQKGLKYGKIILEQNKNYLLDGGNSGFFQCWKFFWHNKDLLKKFFNIDNPRFNEIKNIMQNMGDIIAIHIRLTDYVGLNFYVQLTYLYYENIIKNYDVNKYKIILFSDDIDNAKKILEKIECLKNIEIINANSITNDDEEQFIMLCYSKIRICPNSSYSLTSCYLTEIYDLIENRTYHFPNKWYNTLSSNFDIKELINTENKNFILNECF